MRERILVPGLSVILCFCSLSGCGHQMTQMKSENDAEIQLAFEQKEEKGTGEKADLQEGDLLTMFEEVNTEAPVQFWYSDYNKDGRHEAFVLTKEDGYKLWYLSPDGCEMVDSPLEQLEEQEVTLLSFETKDYLVLPKEVKGKKNTLVYSIDNMDRVQEAVPSGKGCLYQNRAGDLLMDVYDERDGGFSCTYYLYYVWDAGFREYGAIPISEEQFLEFEGAQEIMDGISEQYADSEVEYTFLYRSNSYIHINVAVQKNSRQENYYMTLKYDSYKVESVTEGLMPGRVETACMLEIATFPILFKHPEQKITE